MSPDTITHHRTPHPVPHPVQNPLLGIALKVTSVLLLLGLAAILKLTREIPIGQVLFVRFLVALLGMLALMAWQRQLHTGLKTKRVGLHFIRTFIGVFATGTIFMAIRFLPLPDATALNYATPLIITVLGVFVLKERIGLFRSVAVIIGFVGVLIIVWPNLTITEGFSLADTRSLGVVLALSGALMLATAQTITRILTRTDSSATIVLYFSIFGCLMTLLTIPFGWIALTQEQLGLLILVGCFGGMGQFLVTQAYRVADLSIVAPFEYSSLIFSIIVGYFFFAEVPTLFMIVGGLIVTAAGIAIILRERHLREQKKIDNPAAQQP